MIPFFPYKRFVILTSLTTEECVSLISSAISPRRNFSIRLSPSRKEFEGTVDEQGFKIHKVIYNRNSFLPVLYGNFIPSENGTKIEVRLTLDKIVSVFSIIWFVGMGGFSLFESIIPMITGKLDEVIWGPLIVVGLFILMLLVGFGSYAQKTEDFIVNVFESHKIQQDND